MASPRLEKLADAIVSVEDYMEMLQAGRPEPWRMLDHAEQGLAALEPETAGSGRWVRYAAVAVIVALILWLATRGGIKF